MRLYRQFTDADAMTKPKEVLSVRPKDIEQVRAMMESMAKDLAAQFPNAVKSRPAQHMTPESAQQQGMTGQGGSQPTQPAPLTGANLEKQTQALNRTGSKGGTQGGGRPPSAPTTSKPPFQFGGAQSPHGQPSYIGKASVTQEDLHLPARKKSKTAPQVGQAPGTVGTNSSPQVSKTASPEVQKRAPAPEAKAPPKPQFPCPHEPCEANSFGFSTEEARRAHINEEHIKPHQDPMKYAYDSLAGALGLDPDGNPKARVAEGTATAAPLMAGNASQQGQTPTSAASMSRGPSMSMKRQESAAGPKAVDTAKKAAAKGVGQKPAGMTAPLVKVEEDRSLQQATMLDTDFTFTTIDPQDLFQNLGTLQSGGGGAISDMNVYRSVTPNDTPESSKDSASSEPNSDVSEGVALNLSLDMGFDSWQPFEGDRLVKFGEVDMDMLDGGDFMMMGDQGLSEFTSWDDVNTDFTKPFELDTAFYSFDTT
jgi:hypothetical protein